MRMQSGPTRRWTKLLPPRSTLIAIGILVFALGGIAPADGRGQAVPGTNSGPLTTQSGTSSTPEAQARSSPGQFYDPELDLRVNYPVEMTASDAAADMESGHRNIFGTSGDNDPEHLEAKRCIHPLLHADLPKEKAPKRPALMTDIWVDDSEEYKNSRREEPIMAQIVLFEFERKCMPKKLRNHPDDILGSLARTFVSVPGMQRMPKPLWSVRPPAIATAPVGRYGRGFDCRQRMPALLVASPSCRDMTLGRRKFT